MTGDLINHELLAALESDLGDRELIAELMRTYLGQLPARVEGLRTAATDPADTAHAFFVVHALRSPSASLGLSQLAQRCAEIEENLATIPPGELCLRIRDLVDLAERTGHAVMSYLSIF